MARLATQLSWIESDRHVRFPTRTVQNPDHAYSGRNYSFLFVFLESTPPALNHPKSLARERLNLHLWRSKSAALLGPSAP
jgi:hypothetical protein